jgi:hypothetical protein
MRRNDRAMQQSARLTTPVSGTLDHAPNYGIIAAPNVILEQNESSAAFRRKAIHSAITDNQILAHRSENGPVRRRQSLDLAAIQSGSAK